MTIASLMAARPSAFWCASRSVSRPPSASSWKCEDRSREPLMNQKHDCFSRWVDLLSPYSVPETALRHGFEELGEAYSGPKRFYHNLDHVSAVLDTIDRLADLARDLSAVQLAAWYHDAVYDSRASDNEERSAALATEHCS